MIVTHENSNITHVAMGGLEAIECGITGDAHFMHMLSASLYKDQKLAMVREVVCNAWDAHIMVGKTDPIEITIDNEELVIKDFGPGISHEMIGPIYGVYGASTKKNDGKQTGGFGLGCKSPWSYTDTFEVISCHDGKKAIYQMTKSASEREGKPSIKPIVVNLPTTETGITVKIRIKSNMDSGEIMSNLRKVLYYGGIPCKLNGKLAKTIDYDNMKSNWLVTNHLEDNTMKSMLLVRYGNVVYPITNHADYNQGLRDIHKFMKTLPSNTHGYAMIFQAPPDSLAPTPSREELSMIEMTTTTLKGLIETFLDELAQDGTALTIDRAMSRIQKAGERSLLNIMELETSIPKRTNNELFVNNGYYNNYLARSVVELGDLTDLSLDMVYPGSYIRGFRKLDILKRFEVIKAKLEATWDKRLLKTFIKALHSDFDEKTKQQEQWFTRNVSGWVIKKMLARTKEMKAANLYVLGQGQGGNYWGKRLNAKLQYQLTEFQQFTTPGFFHMIPFLTNRVVLTHSRTMIQDRMYMHKDYLDSGRGIGSLVYVVPRSPRMAQEAKDFFTSIGMTIIDMLEVHDWESSQFKPTKRPPKDPNAPKVKAVKKTGFIRFDASVANGHYHPQENARDNPDAIRIEKPEFFVKLQSKTRDGYNTQVGTFSPRASGLIARLYGQYGAIVQKDAQIEQLMKQGVKTVDEWVLDRIFKEMKTNKRIREYIGTNPNRLHKMKAIGDLKYMNVLSFLQDDETLNAHYGLGRQINDRDEQVLTLYRELVEQVSNQWGNFRYLEGAHQRVREWTKLKDKIDDIQPAGYLVSLAQKLEGNIAVELFNTSNASQILRSKDESDERKAQVRNIIIEAIG